VTFTGHSSQHPVVVELYDNDDAFGDLRRPFLRRPFVPAATAAMALVDDVPPGVYALMAFEDLNGNGVLDRNFLGIPKEPTAFSQDYSPKGPPVFSRASFTLSPGAREAQSLAFERVLGRAGASPGAVHFGDAVAPDGIEPVVSERTRVSLTSRRTAARGRLMTLEVLEPFANGPAGSLVPLVLEGAVRCPEGDAEAAEVVALGLAMVRSIGADRSRGLGRVRVAVRVAPEVRR
jgi:uncharacterized protein (DUF2141 family)